MSATLPTLIIVSGLSGSGKSVVLKTFEDLDYYCVDNLPVELLPEFVKSLLREGNGPSKLAVGIDVRAARGTDQVTGFVRFDGHPVGVIASDSRHVNGGALTADGCDKLKRHLDLCDLFHIPLLNLVDNPGFAVGLEHEVAGTIRRTGYPALQLDLLASYDFDRGTAFAVPQWMQGDQHTDCHGDHNQDGSREG